MATYLKVTGMTCGHCEQSVVSALESVEGVEEATADRENNEAAVKGEADSAALIAAVEEAGYTAE